MQKRTLNLLRPLLAALVLVCTVSSVCFMAHERFHACSGEDCPVCQIIQLSAQAMKLLGVSLAAAVTATAVPCAAGQPCVKAACVAAGIRTLVSQKVRLND